MKLTPSVCAGREGRAWLPSEFRDAIFEAARDRTAAHTAIRYHRLVASRYAYSGHHLEADKSRQSWTCVVTIRRLILVPVGTFPDGCVTS